MRVFVIGATGYLGAGAARALAAAGHEIVTSARTPEAFERLGALGYAAVRGDAAEPSSLAGPARSCDATVYAVNLERADAAAVDSAALGAIVEALEGSSKGLIYTSGIWFYGPTGDRIADEEAPADPPPTAAARPRLEKIVLDGARRGVRSVVLRPGDVFGEGKGLPALFVGSARETGAARTFGDGANRWPVVHIDDLAELYRLAVERGAPGVAYNATDETAFTQLEIAQAASRGAGRDGATTVWPIDQAIAALGEWVVALTMDQRVSSARARERLGWSPNGITILEDLERGSYAEPRPR